jgi:peptide/nickel transport system substrate-binding protein
MQVIPGTSMLRIAAEKVAFLPATRVTDDTSVLTLKNLVFEPLCRWRDGLCGPGLFDRWEHDDDGRHWLFHIRDGAAFHDGKPCVADDILQFIDAILGSVDSFGMKWAYARYLVDAKITAASQTTIAVVNPRPFADILDVFAEFYVCRETILGTGPYRVTGYDGVEAHLAKSDERISLTAIARAADRYQALHDGTVDVALNLERMDSKPDFNDGLRWEQAVNTLSVMYYLNCSGGPFATREARIAANLAVDRRRLIDELFFGLGVPATTIVSPNHLGFRSAALPPIPYDPDGARRLLDRTTPRDITIRTPEYMPERARQISEAVAEALRQIGLDVRLDVQSDRPEYAREVGRKQIGDMAIFDSSPQSTYRVLNDKISSRVKGVWWQGYDDAEVETLIEAANGAVSDDQRERNYGRCLARLHANPPWLYLFHPIDVCASAPHVRGVSLDHKGVLRVAS